MAAKINLTKTLVSEAKPGPKDRFLWDGVIAGFGVKITPTGRKVFLAQYRVGGKLIRKTLGTFGAMTVDEARTQAKALINSADDPTVAHTTVTLNDLWTRLEKLKGPSWKPNTVRNYVTLYDRHLKPVFGHRTVTTIKVHEITTAIVEGIEAKRTGNLARELMVQIINFGIDLELLPVTFRNPASAAKRFAHKLKGRDKALTAEQIGALFKAISELEDQPRGMSSSAANALRMIALTGARLREIISARWSWLTERDGVAILNLPDSKTGAKQVYIVGPALEVLRSIDRVPGNPHIFVGQNPGAPLTDINTPWRRACLKAGIPYGRKGFVVHDLRHSWVTVGSDTGVSLSALGKAVGHSSERMTQRYSNPNEAAAIAATSQTVGQFADILGDNVVKFRRAS